MLFNGGVFESPVLRQRLLDVLRQLGSARRRWQPIVLDNDRLDLAVARGAAYYGMVRRGQGVRIAAGLARTYYIGVERSGEQGAAETARLRDASPLPLSRSPPAVCLLPAGVEPGHDVELSQRRFDLLVSEPVEFPLFVSSTRLTDQPGELVPIDREQMTPLPPIRTVLRTRKKGEAETVAVNLHARLTEIGTLDLWCSEIDGQRSWRLQFDVRSATQTDIAAHESPAESEGFVDEATWQECRAADRESLRPRRRRQARRPGEAAGGGDRHEPQRLAHVALPADLGGADGGRSRAGAQAPVHEARWLNLLGFALRPGYGLAVDDWRVAETWRLVQGKLAHPSAAVPRWKAGSSGGGSPAGWRPGSSRRWPSRCWARSAACTAWSSAARARRRFRLPAPRNGRNVAAASARSNCCRSPLKIELGGMLLDLLPKRKMEPVRPAIVWAIGRLGGSRCRCTAR